MALAGGGDISERPGGAVFAEGEALVPSVVEPLVDGEPEGVVPEGVVPLAEADGDGEADGPPFADCGELLLLELLRCGSKRQRVERAVLLAVQQRGEGFLARHPERGARFGHGHASVGRESIYKY